jgi:hypothetical protein
MRQQHTPRSVSRYRVKIGETYLKSLERFGYDA